LLLLPPALLPPLIHLLLVLCMDVITPSIMMLEVLASPAAATSSSPFLTPLRPLR
jgi:hypothetical protein